MNADLYERALKLLDEVADEFERLSGLEIPVTLPNELRKSWIDAQAYRDALAELFEKPEHLAIREQIVPLFRKHRELAEPFEEDELDVKLYDDDNEYPPGEEPRPSDGLVADLEELVEEVRRDRLLSCEPTESEIQDGST